jgi:hypothetical protein
MSEHEDLTARAEQQADDLEERTDALGEQIDETRDDWEKKKTDPKVPGAAGDPERAEGDLPPEQNVTQQGD